MYKYYQHQHLIHHLHFKKFLHNKYNELVIADSFRRMALSMISLFIPIFLLKLNFSFAIIALLEMVGLLLVFLTHLFLTAHISRWGIKHVLIASYCLNIILYIVLYNARIILPNFGPVLFLLLVGFLNAVSMAIYWSAHHLYFLCTTNSRHNGSKTGILMAVPVLFGIVGPLVGAYLITSYNFQLVFLTGALLLVFASGVLFFSKNIKVPGTKLKIKKIIDKKHWSKNSIYLMQGITFSATSFMWPMFMFLSAITLIGIGFVHLLSSVAHSIFCYEAGRQMDKNGNRSISRVGAIGHGITLIGRSLITTVVGASIWQTLGGIFAGFYFVPLEAAFYKHSHHDIVNKMLNRELYLNLGRISLFIFFFSLLPFFNLISALMITLIAAGISTVLLSLIIKQDKTIID